MAPAKQQKSNASSTPSAKAKGKAKEQAPRTKPHSKPNADEDVSMASASDDEGGASAEESGEDDDDGSGSESPDTDTEIALAQQPGKSKQTLKRKRRAIQPSSFGHALTSLLSTDLTTTASSSKSKTQARTTTHTNLLALTSTSKKEKDNKLEKKARKVLLVEKKEKEELGRVTDVIGGWGGESERALRKVAQRGVVQLFNTIRQAQESTVQTTAELSTHRGTGKPTLPAPRPEGFGAAGDRKKGQKAKDKDNLIGRAKPVTLGQEDFMNSIRSGTVVSKV